MNNETGQRPAPFENNTPSQNFFLIIGMYLICFVLANVIGILCFRYIAGLSLAQMSNPDFTKPIVLLSMQIGQIIGACIAFIAPVIFFVFFTARNKIESLTLNKSGKISTLLLGGLLMLCASPFINYLAALNSHIQFPDFIKELQDSADKVQEAFLKNQTISVLILNIFMIGLVAAVAEELFFRAVLQKALAKWTKNIHASVWITGFLFSFLHFEFYGFIPRMLMGVYLGYLFVWSGSIWVPIFAHFINNTTSVLLVFLEDHNVVQKGMGEIGSQAVDKPYIIASTITVAVLLFFIYKIENKKIDAPPT